MKIKSGASKGTLSKAVVVPDLLLMQAPLLKTEALNEYKTLFESLAAVVGPLNGLEWWFVKDLVDALWEIRRYRRIKSAIFEVAQREHVFKVFKDLPDPTIDSLTASLTSALSNKAKTKAGVWASGGEGKAAIDAELAKYGYSAEVILAGASIAYLPAIEEVDRLLGSAEARRNNALRCLEEFSPMLAKRSERAGDDIVDVEFREVATGDRPSK